MKVLLWSILAIFGVSAAFVSFERTAVPARSLKADDNRIGHPRTALDHSGAPRTQARRRPLHSWRPADVIHPTGNIERKVLEYDPTDGFSTPGYVGAVAVGDVTGDGREDMIAVSSRTQTDYSGVLTVVAQTDSVGFSAPVEYELGAGYDFFKGGLALTDFNGDGVQDAVVGMNNGIAVLLFGRDGVATKKNVVLGREIHHLGTLDVDLDGDQDVIGISWGNIMGGSAPQASTLFYNDGQGGLQNAVAFETPQRGYNDLKVGDVTGDGNPDLVITSRQAFHYWVIPHNGSNGFLAPRAYPNQDPIWSFGSAAIGDFNGDGRNDVAVSVWANIQQSSVWVYFQNANGGLGQPVRRASLDLSGPMLGYDIDNDARKDLVVLHEGGYNFIGRYRHVSNEHQYAEELFPITAGGNSVNRQGFAIGHINTDHCPDAVFAGDQYLLYKTGKGCFNSRPQRAGLPLPPRG
jgi:hypothetical protein